MNKSFTSLCQIIIETNGNPTCAQVRSCGYSFEAFLRMAQPHINKERLVTAAKQMLQNTEGDDNYTE